MHEEEGSSCFHYVHCCINVLDPGWKPKVTECSWLSLHKRASHCPEHGFCRHTGREKSLGFYLVVSLKLFKYEAVVTRAASSLDMPPVVVI